MKTGKFFFCCLLAMALPLLAGEGGDGKGRQARGEEGRQRPMGFVWLSDANEDSAITQEEWQIFVDSLEVGEDGTVDLAALRPQHGSRSDRPDRAERPRRGPHRPDGEGGHSLTLDDLNALFAQLDANGDQILTSDEVPKPRKPRNHGKRER